MATVDPNYPQAQAPAAVPVQTQPGAVAEAPPPVPVEVERPELRIYGHGEFFYWWPVWVTGGIIVLLHLVWGQPVTFKSGGSEYTELFLPGKNPGVVFTVVLFLNILLTNITVRGLASVVTILSIMFLTVLFAWLGWWDVILSWVPNFTVHMNMGFYVFITVLMFATWAFSTFVYDRMSYWVVRPGQIVHEFVIGGAEKSYDTLGMVFEKIRQDFFRNWILGFGTGNLKIVTTGARHEELVVSNVLFVDTKVQAIQKMIATRPNQFVREVPQ